MAQSTLRSSATDHEVNELRRILVEAIGNEYAKIVEDSLEILTRDEDADYIDEWKDVSDQTRPKLFHYSPLMLACHRAKADTSIVTQLLDRNTAIFFRKKEKGGLNAFHVACFSGNLGVVTLLIERAKLQIHRSFQKPCLNAALKARTTKDGLTPLMFAVKSKSEASIEVVKALLETEVVDLKQTNKKHQNIFHIATHEQKLLILVELYDKLDSSSNQDFLLAVDKCGWGLLHHACAGGTGEGEKNCEILQWLFEHMPQLSSPDYLNQKAKNTEYTPLLVACEYQKIAVVKMLIAKADVDVSILTNDQKNCLHIAAIHDSNEIAGMLMEKRSSLIQQQDFKGDTPLHIARRKASFNVLDVFKTSKEAEDVQNLKNKKGLTVGDIQPEDVIPAEIKKRGREAVEIYKNALKKGKVNCLQCNLLILGQERVGKTSLYRLLVGKCFVPDLDPTRGIDNEIIEGEEMVDHRCVSTAKFQVLTDNDVKKENDAAIVDTIAAEVQKHAGPIGKRQKPQAVSEKVLSSELYGIKAKIQKRMEETQRRHQEEAAKMLRKPKLPIPLLFSGPLHDPPHLAIPKAEQDVSKGNATFPKQPDPQLPKTKVVLSEPKQTAQPKPAAPPKKKVRLDKPLEEADSKQLETKPGKDEEKEEEAGRATQSEALGPLVGRGVAKAISKQLKNPKKRMEPKLRFNVLDFAGQPEYRPMHHCFITRRAIHIVVFNLQKVIKYLQDKGSDCKIDDPFEEMRYWLNSISAHVSQLPGDEHMKRVLLVGTHKNPQNCATPLTAKLHKRINKMLHELFIDDGKSRCINHLHTMTVEPIKDDIFAAVENSIDGITEDKRKQSGAELLQGQLQIVAKRLPFVKEQYPNIWLMFEKRLIELRENLKRRNVSAIVKIAAVEDIAHDCGIDSSTEIEVALKFFHEVGKICCLKWLPKLFLSADEQEMLASLVLLNPKWLIRVMKYIMEIEKSDHKGDWIRDLEKTGKASIALLRACWADCVNNDLSFEQLCLMLKAYGLIYPMEAYSEIASSSSVPDDLSCSTSEGKFAATDLESEALLHSKNDDPGAALAPRPSHYLIPCKLPQYEPPPEEKASIDLKPAHVFWFDFLGFLPDEVFQRLICLLLRKAQAEPPSVRQKKSKIPQFTRTRCQFYFDECLWEIQHEVPHSVLSVSVLKSYSKHQKQPSFYLKKIHAEFLCKICKESGLEGLMYYGGPRVECKCGWTGILQVQEYNGKDPPSEENPARGQCDKCTEWIDTDKPESQSKDAAASGSEAQLRLTLTLSCLRDLLYEARSKWKHIAIGIDLERSVWSSIPNDHPNNDGDRLTAVIDEWLKRIDPESPDSPKSSWEKLATALHSPAVGYPNIARKIEKCLGIASCEK